MGSKDEIQIGKKFGDWTVLQIDVKNPESKAKRVRKSALCQCKCGKIQYIEYRALYDGRTIDCGCESYKRRGQTKVQNYSLKPGTIFNDLMVLEDLGMIEGKHKSKCQCLLCNKIIIVANQHLKSGHTTSCGCRTESIGIKNIKKLLNEYKIKYKQEYTFPDLLAPITNAHLRFDFAIFDQNLNLVELIEFDGMQHFEPKTGYYEGRFEQIQQYDDIKNKYCENHNIQLIRIPYLLQDRISLDLLKLNNLVIK